MIDWQLNKPDYVVYLPPEGGCRQVNEHFHVLESPVSGDYLAFWTQESFEGSDDMHVAFCRSSDGGLTWTAPTIFQGSPKRGSGIPNAIWQLPFFSASGRLYCLWNERPAPGPGQGVGYMKGAFSDDDGRTWSSPETLWQPRRWCGWQRPLRLAEGRRFLTAVSISEENDAKTFFMRIDNADDDPPVRDLAITLSMDGTETLDGEEASVVKLPDGRLFAVMRSRFGHPLWSQSPDGGMNWSRSIPLVDASGNVVSHPRAPCPIYDILGDAAGSGRYFALFTDAFDPSRDQWEGRGPLHIYRGAFDPSGNQPVAFEKGEVLLRRSGETHYGNSCYSSYTFRDGEGVLWFPDEKRYLLGRRILG